jgi:class 3 adenylate cyclase/predicted ATPase
VDVGDWLRSLGLPQYEAAFRENAIDSDVLPELSEGDLEKLGLPLGHRKRLLKAISALGSTPTATNAAPTPGGAPAHAAERRQLTVMFVDLVGSTALSARLDPEDMREIIGAYHRCCAEQITKAGGFVAKYMGDGVLAYFGYPRAHEDDAERAVRGALALIEEVPKLQAGHDAVLAVRLGIATGLVVVGDLIGEGDAQERGVVGDTPNLAARLQGIAEPNTVVIADRTRALLGNLFELEDLGPRDLKGIAGPTRAWAVLRARAVESRFEALHESGLIALVERDEEMELLARRWSRAKAGEGQVVLLSGEAGIGKSRLTAALLERLATEPHTRLRYFCSPQRADSALHPIIGQMERAAGLAYDDKPQAKLDKLDAVLAQTSTSPQDAALFAEMLSLPNDGRYPVLELAPQQRRQRTLEALTAQLAELARQQPVLMIFEDAHWIDPTSLEVLGRTVDRIKTLPVLLIVTFRPEFNAPWVGQSHVTSLTLNRLGQRDAAVIVAHLVGGKVLPSDVLAEIVDRTDGIPLFVEEMTKAVLEAESEGAARRTVAAAPLPAVVVPASLQASLMARLDRLGPAASEIAQIGAVIGREFSNKLIRRVAQRPEPELEAALDRLTGAGLLFRRGVPPHSEYLFKHALVQDAAYATLLRARRRQLHEAIAAALEREFPETVATQPELLAHHCTEAGLTEQAVQYWRRAGEHALERSANLEAIAHFTRGIQLLDGLPQSRQRDEQELVFQAALIAPLWTNCGFGSPEAERASRRALELCERAAPDTPAHFRALYGLAYAYLMPGDLRRARPLAEQLLDLAKRRQDPEHLAYAHFEMGTELLWSAELAAACAHFEQGIALYDPEWGRPASSRHGFNCVSNCHMFLARVSWHLGYPEQALRHSGQAVAIAEGISHPFSRAVALSWAAALHQLRGETRQTQELAEISLALATEQGFPFLAAFAMVFRGWALVEQGQSEEGIAQLRDGLVAYRATGAELESSHWLGLLAEACRDTGQTEDGLRVIAEAFDHVAQTGIVYYEPELRRLEGELRLRQDPANAQKAETCFRCAVETAREQQAKSWELRASTSLARLWRDQGKRTDARDLLAPIHGWFTEGFDTLDLKEAKALLDALAR